MVLVSTRQAAERLALSTRQVQRLVVEGELTRVGTDRIDAASVEQWLAQRPEHRVRAWAEETAWAAIALLEGDKASWVGQSRRSRIRAALLAASSTELVARTRDRARARRYFAHPQAHSWLAGHVVPSGALNGVAGLSAVDEHDRVDGYLPSARLLSLVTRFRMEHDPAGRAVLRETRMPVDVVQRLSLGPHQVLAGLDLAGSTDDRERSAGYRLLGAALARYRDTRR